MALHEHALDAARAACCGDQLGKGDAMAEALFSAPVEELTPDGCAKLAVSLGLDENAFRSCTQDPATDARIQADSAEFRAAEGHGLPTLWVGQRKIEGAQPAEVFERAIRSAIDSRS
jgi:predicted DsbA family dithiol-disulfide isomerase